MNISKALAKIVSGDESAMTVPVRTSRTAKLAKLLPKEEGFTINIDSPEVVPHGFAVAMPHQLTQEQIFGGLTDLDREKAVALALQTLPEGNRYIGGWNSSNPAEGSSLEPTQLFGDRSEAVQKAIDRNQLAVGILDNGEYKGEIITKKLMPFLDSMGGSKTRRVTAREARKLRPTISQELSRQIVVK